jgi:hypothetical protein
VTPSDWAPVVHLWQPYAYHDPAYIVGNRDGLVMLRDAVQQAIDDGYGEANPYVADGEGYTLEVRCVKDTDHQAVPYTADDAAEDRPGVTRPWEAT